jgi:hypothetical protein
MKRNIIITCFLIFTGVFSFSIISLFGQNNLRTMIAVDAIPDKPGWNYKLGEKAVFNVTISKF